jgi:hypothetical protein
LAISIILAQIVSVGKRRILKEKGISGIKLQHYRYDGSIGRGAIGNRRSYFILLNPFCKSAIKSSASSIPIESLMKPSVIPKARRASGFKEA